MMPGTPRTFVGPAVLLLEAPLPTGQAEQLTTALLGLPGIDRCDLDAGTGTLVVTAVAPVDRADVVDVLDRLGCRHRG
jgi:hypothetical protein